MTGNHLIALPRLKVGILSALLYLSPLCFSQLYVVSTEELHIVENTIVVDDVIIVSDSLHTAFQDENNPENGESALTVDSKIAFLPILPDPHITAVIKPALAALPDSNYQNRIGLTALNGTGISPVYSEFQNDPETFQNRVYYQEIAIFAIRPPPVDI